MISHRSHTDSCLSVEITLVGESVAELQGRESGVCVFLRFFTESSEHSTSNVETFLLKCVETLHVTLFLPSSVLSSTTSKQSIHLCSGPLCFFHLVYFVVKIEDAIKPVF